MKYKVGDKVRIRQLKALERVCQKTNNFLRFNGHDMPLRMSKYCGEIATITKVQENSYKLDIDGGQYSWQDWMFEGYAFEFGEEVEFSDDKEDWCEKIYLGYIDGAEYPYICVRASFREEFEAGRTYITQVWRYARPIQKKHKIIIDGKEIKINEESYQKLKGGLK